MHWSGLTRGVAPHRSPRAASVQTLSVMLAFAWDNHVVIKVFYWLLQINPILLIVQTQWDSKANRRTENFIQRGRKNKHHHCAAGPAGTEQSLAYYCERKKSQTLVRRQGIVLSHDLGIQSEEEKLLL